MSRGVLPYHMSVHLSGMGKIMLQMGKSFSQSNWNCMCYLSEYPQNGHLDGCHEKFKDHFYIHIKKKIWKKICVDEL